MYKISVIVPVYNTEKYIKKCLDSLVNQTMKKIEIIVINDGSKDHSEEIIKEYENKYPEIIKYYKKENGGLSSARNYGVEKASGKYISFVDSDDYIDKDLFSKLENYMAENIDLIKFKTIKKYQDGKIEKIYGPTFDVCSGQEAFNKLYSNDILMEPAWLYLYKKEFWTNNNFMFAENLYHEDFGLTPIVIASAKTVISTEFYGYYYIQRENSIVTASNKNVKKAYDLLKHYDNMIEEIKNMNLDKKTKENLKIYYTNCIFLKINELNKIEQKEYIKEIKRRKMIKNIKVRNLKQLVKKIILKIDVRLYLKLR